MEPHCLSRNVVRLLTLAALLGAAGGLAAVAALPRGNPASRVAAAGANAEAWDLTGQFESGHWLFARFMITNDGPGQRTGVAIGHLVFPDGRVEMFKNGRLEGDWTLAADGLAFKVGSSRLDLHAPRRLGLGTEKRGLKVNLEFDAGEFAAALEQARTPAFAFDLLQAGTAAQGTIWTRGAAAPTPLRGRVALTHVWSAGSESATVHRQVEFLALLGDEILYVVQLTPPRRPPLQWLALLRDGKLVRQTSDFELTVGARFAGGESKYEVPGSLRIRANGFSADVDAEKELLRNNPMEIIPNPFRYILSLTSSPRRVWLGSTFRIEASDEAGEAKAARQGRGVMAVSFTNPFGGKS